MKIIWPFYFKFATCLFHIWATYSFSFNYSRLLKFLFSFKFFIPFSRLSLIFSVIQFIYLHYSLASTRTIFVFNRFFVLKEFIASFLLTFIITNLAYLFFEQPFNNLFKNYYGLKKRREVHEDKTN